MGELEPDDSRNVTLSDHQAPGEPPRTGPREGESRGQQQSQWRSDAQGQTQGQNQTNESDWRAAEAEGGREAQDHDKAAGIDGPSQRPDADDGQWSQQPEDLGAASGEQATQGEPVDRESDLKLGTEMRGPRDTMSQPDEPAGTQHAREQRREQSERGGG